MEITTAAQLEKMTPAERQAHFEASIVWEPDSISDPQIAALVERSRQRTLQRIESTETTEAS
jgi:hypothetical protein